MSEGSFTANRGLRWVVFWGLLVAFLFRPSMWSVNVVQGQSGAVTDAEARRRLDLGQIYESMGEWDLALEEYRVVAHASSQDIAGEARNRLKRIQSYQNSFWSQVTRDLHSFAVWAVANLIKLLVVLGVLICIGRFLLLIVSRRTSWTVMPFHNTTEGELGEAVAERIVALLHEVRFAHLEASKSTLCASEHVDLPAFRASSSHGALLSSLQAMDSLDVSGVGLPMGSVLASAVRWLDTGRRHIEGTVQHRGQSMCLTAQLREGRSSGIIRVWTACGVVDEDGAAAKLSDLERDLAFQILYDLQAGWDASNPSSLRLFTEGLQRMREYQLYPSLQEGALQEAAALFEQALLADPTYNVAKYNLATVYHTLGQHEQAVELLRSLRMQPGHGLELEIAYSLGAAYYHRLGYWTYDYAEQEFSRVLEALVEPDISPRSRELCALAHCGMANVHAQRMHLDSDNREEHFRLASDHYHAALGLASEDFHVLAIANVAMGLALLNRGQAIDAVTRFEEAVRLKPDYWRAYVHWGRALMATEDYVHAVRCLRQATVLNPRYEFAYYQLGIALKQIKEIDEAAEAFASAKGIAQAHDERGYILAEYHQDLGTALAELEHALALKPDLSNAMAGIAWYILEAGYCDDEALDRALQHARRAVELDEGTANAWHRHCVLGRVHLARNKLADAKDELELAVRLGSERPQSYYFLAETNLRLGELTEARKALAEFLKRPGDSSWYRKTRPSAVALMREISAQIEAKKTCE